MSTVAEPIDPGVDIGHVHLKVSDLDRALAFYRDVLGFEEQQRYGDEAAFVSAGGYHHHIGLNTWESKGGSPPPPGTTGLYHFAIRYPSRKALANALKSVLEGAAIREGDVVLDVGAGDGLIAFGALRLVGETGKVVFSDVSQDLLDVSRGLARELDAVDRCEFVLARAEDLAPIADESVDVVTTRSVVIYVEEKQRAFDAFHRVLRPGGRL